MCLIKSQKLSHCGKYLATKDIKIKYNENWFAAGIGGKLCPQMTQDDKDLETLRQTR